MLEFIDLMEFEVVVAPKLGGASSHGVGGFQQVVTLNAPGERMFQWVRDPYVASSETMCKIFVGSIVTE